MANSLLVNVKLITHFHYKTKSKWTLSLQDGMPYEYYRGGHDESEVTELEPGENILYFGSLKIKHTERGRSSIAFVMDTYVPHSNPNPPHRVWKQVTFTATNMNDLVKLIASGDIRAASNGDVSELTGYWTTSKQGTTIGFKAVSEADAEALKKVSIGRRYS